MSGASFSFLEEIKMADAMDIAQRSLPVNRAGFGGYGMWYDEVASRETALCVALHLLYPEEKEREALVLGLEVKLAMGPNFQPEVRGQNLEKMEILKREVRRRPQMLKRGRDVDLWAKGEIVAPGLREAVEAASADKLKAFGFTRLAQMEQMVMKMKPSEIDKKSLKKGKSG
jgi:hypothetical protein